ncbi:MAG: hypothetical protein R3B09_22505 [Nannocystaceae bacterium]
MSSNHEAAFKAAVAERERQICIDLLRSTPELTLGEIQRLSKGELGRVLSTVTIADLIAGVARPSGGAAPAPAAKPAKASGKAPRARAAAPAAEAPAEAPAPAAPAKASKPKKVETRTPAGRLAYDDAMLAALREMDGPVGVAALMGKVGGSNLQARAALNRLIAAGKITWAGKARGTRYMIEQ